MLKYGGGRHAILLNDPIKFAQACHQQPLPQLEATLTHVHTQSVLAAEVFYPPAIASVKISTLFLFSRIFPGRQFRILLHTVGIFVITYSGIMVLGAIFQCIPIRGGWDTTVKAKCIKINMLWMIMAGMNVLTDFILLCAPLPTLWGLQMQRAMKGQLMAIFGIGGLYAGSSSTLKELLGLTHNSVCVISIYRIPKLYGLSLVDASWSNADTTIWSLVEVSVAIACACAIVYRPLFDRFFRTHSSAAGSYGSRKISKPKLVEWDSHDAVKMQRVRGVEKGSVVTGSSESRLKGDGWENLT